MANSLMVSEPANFIQSPFVNSSSCPRFQVRAAKMLPVSTFVHMLDEDDFGKPLPNLSPLFQSSTADLILSSCDSYHVSLFSPWYK